MSDLSLRLPDPATFGPEYDAQIFAAAQRGRMQGQRDFMGARLGRGTSFINALQRRDAEIRKDVTSLRAHSRHLDNNNPWARNYFRMMETDVVGPKGFTLQARVRKPGETDLWEDVNDILEHGFRAWSQKGVCTVDGRHSFLGVCRLTGRTLPLDGEVFIREVYGTSAGNGWGYGLQLLDADLLDVNFNQEPGNGRNAVVMGVELSSWGKPVRYWFRPSGTAYSNSYPNGDGRRYPIPAEEIIQVVDPERMNQTRGIPFMAPVMYVVAMLGTYLENELAASRFETERFMMLENPEGMGDYQAAQKIGAQIVSSGLHAQVLPPGYKASAPDLRHPNANLPPYVQTMQHAMAAGLGVSYHGLTRDPSQANYTATRADDMVDRPQKQRLQGVIIETMLERIYRNWLQMAFLSGKVKLPAGVSLEMASEHRWTARGWVLLDPLKDRQADQLGINMAVTTRTEICAEEGVDFEDVVKQLAYEQALLDKHGVKVVPTTVLTVPAESDSKTPKKGGADAASA